jgi:3-oxoacyl-[acyl-carrier-protein] synthase II
MELKRVVVTGLGALTPLGNSVEEYWKGLIEGRSGATLITRFDATNFKTKFACEVKNFDPVQYLDRKEARKHDLYSQFAMAAAEQAVADSGVDLSKLNLDKAGVIWGSGIGGLKTFIDEVTAFAKGNGTPRFNPIQGC